MSLSSFLPKSGVEPYGSRRNITWAKKGKWVHWSKVAFEKYFIYNMKRGSTDPLFQKLALKVMGLNRLKD